MVSQFQIQTISDWVKLDYLILYNYHLVATQYSLMVTVAGLESGIYNGPGFEPTSGHLVLLWVMKLRNNVVMMREGVKIMHQVMHDDRKITQ